HRVLVDPVAELVHGREERRQVSLVGVRRQADVPETGLLRERMRRLVEPPLRVVEPERLEHVPAGLVLAVCGEGPAEGGVVYRVVTVALDQGDQLRLQPVEDLLDLRSPYVC